VKSIWHTKEYGERKPEYRNYQGEMVYRQEVFWVDSQGNKKRRSDRLVSDSGVIDRYSPFNKPINYDSSGIV
jgi:hypothetical protein